jgi:acetyl esterase/lipase
MNCGRTLITISLATSFVLLYGKGTATEPTFNRKEDVIYGRKYGTALTMDVFTPQKNAKGVGVIIVVSGGFVSSHDPISPALVAPLTDRGYTVFTVVHGSQPRYTIPEIIQDMNRSARSHSAI